MKQNLADRYNKIMLYLCLKVVIIGLITFNHYVAIVMAWVEREQRQ